MMHTLHTNPPQNADATEFWRRFDSAVTTICISELKEALLGLSCLGSRGELRPARSGTPGGCAGVHAVLMR
jgi:hypothetical protein